MKIIKEAIVGTLESSDALVKIGPATTGLHITVDSSVGAQFKEDILNTIEQVLAQLEVVDAEISIEDKGALDCVLQARIKAAVMRATDESVNWGKIL